MSPSRLLAVLVSYALASAIQTAAQAPAGAAASPPAAKQPAAEKKPLYDVNADAQADIAAALERARRENRRVLLQWGGNWCKWCIKLHELCAADRQIAKTLKYEYDVVFVDTNQPPEKNLDLAESYGADVKRHGFPYLTILDADGKVLVNQETASLEIDGKNIDAGHDPAKVLAFLKQHAAPPQDANRLFEAALAAARSADKRVFLHFGAPWCPWCHRLEDWLRRPDVAPRLAKDFICQKVDIDRMTGGKDVLARVKGDAAGGIPWFAFLGPDGKPLITSDAPEIGNVGFPYKPDEIAHFAAMLRKVARSMTPDDVAAVLQTMGEKATSP